MIDETGNKDINKLKPKQQRSPKELPKFLRKNKDALWPRTQRRCQSIVNSQHFDKRLK